MSRTRPEYLDAYLAGVVRFREEPDQEEEVEEEEKKDEGDSEEGDNDDGQDNGYSVHLRWSVS